MTQIRIWARLELASSLFTVWWEDADDMITEIAQIEIKSGKPGLMSHASRPGNGPKCDIGDPKLISSDGPPEVFQMSSLVGYTAAFSSLGATVRQPYFSVFCTGEHFMTLSNITRRGMIGGLAAGVSAGTIITSDTFISGARAQSARKTFVLIGGAFYGAWCWHRVTDRLEKQGHKVYALTLTGLAERSHLLGKDINLDTHITDIANLVEWEDLTDICLVAHSYAGCPASGALERIGNRVSSIVWVDAIKPADGQAFRDLVPFPIEEGAISRPAPKALPPTAFSDPKDVAWVLSKVTPQPIGTWLQPVKLSGARERVAKKTYIRLPKFQLAALDKAAGECKSDNSWTVLENTTSGHSVMIAEPDWLTDVLVKAA